MVHSSVCASTPFCGWVLLVIMVGMVNAVNQPWKTLIRHECSGELQVLPSSLGYSIDTTILKKAVDSAMAQAKSRAKCRCAGLSDADFDLMYDPLLASVNIFGPSPTQPLTCSGAFPRSLLEFAELYKVTLPNTCTLSTLWNSGKCMAKYPISNNIDIGIAAWRCPNSYLPGFSVNCLGSGCHKFGMPCDASGECGSGQMCVETGVTYESVRNMIRDAVSSLKLGTGCFIKWSQATADNDIFSSILSWATTNLFGGSKTVFGNGASVNQEFKICAAELSTVLYASQFTSSAISTSTTSLLYSYCDSRNSATMVTLNYAQNWDGNIGDGTFVYTASDPSANAFTLTGNRALGYLFKLPAACTIGHSLSNKMKILQTSCNGEILLADGLIRVKPSADLTLKSLAEQLVEVAYESAKCAIGGGLTYEQFRIRYGLWTLDPFLYTTDPSSYANGLSIGASFNDLRTSMFGARSVALKYSNLPSTCNAESWFGSSASCRFRYTGLKTLYGLDVNVDVSITKCSGKMGLPAILAECTGADCGILFGAPQPCLVNSNCGSNAVCKNVGTPLTNYIPTAMYVFPVSFLSHVAGTDFLGLLFPISGTWCNTNPTEDTACGSVLKWQQNLFTIIQEMYGKPGTPPSTQPLRFCMADVQEVRDSESAWFSAAASVSIDGNTVSIANLLAMNSNGTIQTPTPDDGSGATRTPTPDDGGSGGQGTPVRLSQDTIIIIAAIGGGIVVLLAVIVAFVKLSGRTKVSAVENAPPNPLPVFAFPTVPSPISHPMGMATTAPFGQLNPMDMSGLPGAVTMTGKS